MIFVTNVKLRVHMPWTHKVQNLQLLKFFQLKYCSKYNNNYYYQLKDMLLTEIDSKFVKSGSFSVVETKQISWLINVYFFWHGCTCLLLCENLCCLKLHRMMIRELNLLRLPPNNQLLQQQLIKVGLDWDHNIITMNSWMQTVREQSCRGHNVMLKSN